MKNQIKDFIHRMDNVSFAELMRVIPNSAGERAIVLDGNESVILWRGVSESFAEAIEMLLGDGEIRITSCSDMVYLNDHQILEGLPIAKQPRHYSSPHWLPVCLCRV
jgi:hypothetical protein